MCVCVLCHGSRCRPTWRVRSSSLARCTENITSTRRSEAAHMVDTEDVVLNSPPPPPSPLPPNPPPPPLLLGTSDAGAIALALPDLPYALLGAGILGTILLTLAVVICWPRIFGYKRLEDEKAPMLVFSDKDKKKLDAAREARDNAREEKNKATMMRQKSLQKLAAARDGEIELNPEELAALEAELAAADAEYNAAMERMAAMQAKAQQIADQALEIERRKTVKRIQAYKNAERERNAPPDIDVEMGTNHYSVKAPIPAFKPLSRGAHNELRVCTASPPASARMLSTGSVSGASAYGMAHSLYQTGGGSGGTTTSAGDGPSNATPKVSMAARAKAWVTPRLPSPKGGIKSVTGIFGGFAGRPELSQGPALAAAAAAHAAALESGEAPVPRFPMPSRTRKPPSAAAPSAPSAATDSGVVPTHTGSGKDPAVGGLPVGVSPSEPSAFRSTSARSKSAGRPSRPASPAAMARGDVSTVTTLFAGMEMRAAESLPDYIRRALVEKQAEVRSRSSNRSISPRSPRDLPTSSPHDLPK